MSWIDEVEAATSALEQAESIAEALPWIERRGILCTRIPTSLSAHDVERLSRARDRGQAVLERFRAEATVLRAQLSECHRSGQMMRAFAPAGGFQPQECDCLG